MDSHFDCGLEPPLTASDKALIRDMADMAIRMLGRALSEQGRTSAPTILGRIIEIQTLVAKLATNPGE